MRIICYGDSNTWGYDPRNYFGGRYDKPWPEILSELSGWSVVNLGENGRKISQHHLLDVSNADYLIIMLGTNDLLDLYSPLYICENLRKLVLSLDYDFKKICLVSLPPMTMGAWIDNNTLLNSSKVVNDLFQKLSEDLGIRFVDCRIWNLSLTFDGVHLTQEGHRNFAKGMFSYMDKEILRC